MPLRYEEGRVRFEGHCAVEEALDLTEFLRATPTADVDLSACASLHTALFQAIIASGARVSAAPGDAALARAVMPALAAGVR